MKDEGGRMKNESLAENSLSSNRDRQVAEAIRAASVQAAQQGYERAAADGLCDEGALEVALDAIRSLDLDLVLRELKR
jgi:hypothetical protein